MRFALFLLTAACAPLFGAGETPPASALATPAVVTLPADGLPKIWLQGEPIAAFEPGTLYIFEFWATWCGPCIQAMPHMESLHAAFKERKDVKIVGVNVMDATATPRLLPFLKAKGVSVTYPMAADGGRTGPAQKHWLTPLGVDAIPFAMAVRDGRVVWRGHPTALDKAFVEALSRPDYSAEKAPATRRERMNEIAKRVGEIAGKVRAGDRAEALAGLRRISETEPEERLALGAYDQVFRMFESAEDRDGAFAVSRLMTEVYPESRSALLSAGKMAFGSEVIPLRDTGFALACADKVLAKNPEDVGALELRASALAVRGDRAGALAAQEQAVRSTELRKEIEALRKEIAEGR